jgi:hypothetical protein
MTRLRATLDATALRLVAGLGLLDAAAWGAWGWQAGLAAAGASLLLLDFLSDGEQEATP